MKMIRIRRLALENFKCHKTLTLDFSGENAAIFGDNATGKSSVYDALTWLLFGKDSRGNGEKNIDIKPLDAAGNVRDHSAITSVEAVLEVEEDSSIPLCSAQNDRTGGFAAETITLRKTMRESWVNRRGSSETVYDGNLFDYAVDGVPMKKNEYAARVGALVDEDVFRLLTSVTAFAQDMDWKKRRELLYALSGVSELSDRQIMLSAEEDFTELADTMGSKSLDDLRRILQARRKNLTGVRDQTPARLDELEKQRSSLVGIDFEAAEDQRSDARAEADRLREELAAAKADDAKLRLEHQRRELEAAQKELEMENQRFRMEQQQKLPNPAALQRDRDRLRRQAERLIEAIRNGTQREEACLQNIEEARKLWIRENGAAFTGGTCPSCGQDLPVELLKPVRARFEQQKTETLARIESSASAEKERLEDVRKQMIEDEKERKSVEDALTRLEKELSDAECAAAQVADLPDYAARKAEIEKKLEVIARERISVEDRLSGELSDLRSRLQEAVSRQQQAEDLLAQKRSLRYTEQRIEELKQEQRTASKELEAVEKLIWKIEAFVRYKTRFVEGTVNERFRLARFRLFREQANGGLEERCDVTVDGVPYMSLNSGMKINVGIDLINALSDYFGVRVPLFVDNAESVTQLEPAPTQVIRLTVSEADKQLRLEVA